MAQRQHIFDSQKELEDYLFCFVMSFLYNMDALPEEPTEEQEANIERYLPQLYDNIKSFAGEHRFLVEEGKMDPYLPSLEGYKEKGFANLEEVRKYSLKTQEEVKKFFGVDEDDDKEN